MARLNLVLKNVVGSHKKPIVTFQLATSLSSFFTNFDQHLFFVRIYQEKEKLARGALLLLTFCCFKLFLFLLEPHDNKSKLQPDYNAPEVKVTNKKKLLMFFNEH